MWLVESALHTVGIIGGGMRDRLACTLAAHAGISRRPPLQLSRGLRDASITTTEHSQRLGGFGGEALCRAYERSSDIC